MDVEKSANPEVCDQAQQIEAVKESMTGLEMKTEYLLAFLGNPDISSLPGEKIRANVPHRHRVQINTASYLVHHFFGNGYTGWGLILDQDYILQQSERLIHLIENILDFSRIEEGHKTFRFEKGDIVPLVKEMVESFQILTADQEFRISLEVPESLPQIVFDREGITQVMHNLLDNAVKYSGDSRSIKVTLVRRVDRIVIGIRDHGYGIRKEEQEKIFSRFYRAGEELTQNVKGSGIGLTIVRQIVTAHHGEVIVDSSPGKGSLFSVKLPINHTCNMKILIIEDDEPIRDGTGRRLSTGRIPGGDRYRLNDFQSQGLNAFSMCSTR